MKDNIIFVKLLLANMKCILAITDLFLYSSFKEIFGKLMYTSQPLYGKDSISVKDINYNRFYKAAYRYKKNKIIPLTDKELLQIGIKIGLKKGKDLDKLLCGLPQNSTKNFIFPKKLTDCYNYTKISCLLSTISKFYKVSNDDILLTGGLLLFQAPLEYAHDIDIIIPIDSLKHLKLIMKSYISFDKIKSVKEYGYMWPLRWYTEDKKIICPFFIYRGLLPPIIRVKSLNKKIESIIKIIDTKFSIFNMPIVETKGPIDLLIFRSTLLRGMLKRNQILKINCPLYEVVKGTYSGAIAGVITDPFTEIVNIKEVLYEWIT